MWLMCATPANSCIQEAQDVCGRQTVSRMPARRLARIENVLSLPAHALVQLDLHAAHELHARQAEVHVGACTLVLLDPLPALVSCMRSRQMGATSVRVHLCCLRAC